MFGRFGIAAVVIALTCIEGCAQQQPNWLAPPPQAMAADAAPAGPPPGPPSDATPDPWPRKFSFAGSAGNVTLLVYQPQV